MTQDEIIDMADKAEFVSHGKPSDEESELFVCTDKDIVRFAKLVAERALVEHAMRETQRLGQEIEPVVDDIASIIACRDMLDAQPVPEVDRVIWPEHTEQEPVAWIERDMQCDDFDPDSVTCKKPTIAANGWEWVPLYTHPPQRPWVGLTDEEMHECAGEYPWTPTGLKCVRTIEAKLKQKNGFAEEKNT